MFKIFATVLFCVGTSWVFAANAPEHQAKVLGKRIREVLDYRIKNLKNCSSLDRGLVADYQSLSRTKYRSQQERLEATIDLFKESERDQECRSFVITGDREINKLQQTKFLPIVHTARSLCAGNDSCLSKVESVINDLAPFCATQNGPNLFGKTDPNPCMAGDKLLGRTIRKKNDPTQKFMTSFLSSLERKISAVRPGIKLDLWNHYLERVQDSPANRKKFLGLMAYFYYALGTGGGYIDGVADHFWIAAHKEHKNADEIFNEFFSARQKADWYRNLVAIKARKKIIFTIKGEDISSMNRHDFMARFLACHFREQGPVIATLLPNFLGLGYESLDFVSHIKNKVTVQRSVDNFDRDTERYRQGTTWGKNFCTKF